MAKGNTLILKLTEALEQATAGLQSSTLHGMAESLAGIDVSLKGNVLGELVRALRSLTEQIANMVRHPETAQERGFLHRGARGGATGSQVVAATPGTMPPHSPFTGRMQTAMNNLTAGLNRHGQQLGGAITPQQGGVAGQRTSAAFATAKTGLAQMAQGVQNQQQLTGAGQFVRGAANTVAAGVSMIPGVGPVAAPVIQMLGNAAAKLAEAADKIKNFSSQNLEQAFKYSDVSPSMAMVEARFQMQKMLLNMQRGEALARSGRPQEQAEALIKQMRSQAPTEDVWLKGKMAVGSWLSEKTSEFFEGIYDGLQRSWGINMREGYEAPDMPSGPPPELRDRPHRLRGMGDFDPAGASGGDF